MHVLDQVVRPGRIFVANIYASNARDQCKSVTIHRTSSPRVLHSQSGLWHEVQIETS